MSRGGKFSHSLLCTAALPGQMLIVHQLRLSTEHHVQVSIVTPG